jgi:hypothetical protein
MQTYTIIPHLYPNFTPCPEENPRGTLFEKIYYNGLLAFPSFGS